MNDSKDNKKDKRKGLIVTLSFHAILLVLFCILGFTKLTPPMGEIGMVAMGDVNFGGERDQPNTSETVSKVDDAPKESNPETSSSSSAEEKFSTQDHSPVNITESNKTEKKKKPTPKETTKKEDPKKEEPTKTDPQPSDGLKDALGALMKGDNKKGGTPGGDDEGKQGQDDGGNNPAGGGGGGGPFDFGGRKAITPGNTNHDCGVSGRVQVWVKVNRDGLVVDAKAIGGETNACLMKKAVEAAKGTRYNANPNGPPFQEGNIEVKFKLN